jgi:hypothetical protein
MSGNIFQLAGENAEDYLSFGWAPEEPSSKASKTSKSSKPSSNTSKKDKAADYDYIPDFNIADYMPKTGASSEKEDLDIGKGKKIPKDKVAHHQTLCLQLQSYASHERFEEAIKKSGLKVDKSHTLSIPELEQLLERVRVVAINSTGTGTNPVHAATLGAAAMIEAKVPKRLANLEGYQKACAADPELETICAMLSIDYGFAAMMPLPLRFAMCMGKIGNSVVMQNNMMTQQQSLIASLQAQVNSGASQQTYSSPVPPAPTQPLANTIASTATPNTSRCKKETVYE